MYFWDNPNIMKSLSCCIFFSIFFFYYINLPAQNKELIIGIESDSMYVIDLEDIVLNTGDNGYLTYTLDLDYDNSWDLKFSISFGSGWWGGAGGIRLTASHGTLFTEDTLATQWIGPGDDPYLDTTSTVYKHSFGDTLKIDDHYSDTNSITRIDVWSDPWYTLWWLDDWVGGDNYIGFKTIIDGKFHLGWMKVEVVEHYHIVLKEIAIDSYEVITPELRINEYMIWNQSTLADEYGEYDSWIEIYNPGSDSILLGKYYLTNDITDNKKWKMPGVYIKAGEYVLFWADRDEDQGPFHTDFDLRYGKTVLGILDQYGLVMDQRYMGEYYPDISEGRYPNGGPGPWVLFHNPTPGAPNVKMTGLKINEFMAANTNTIADEFGEYDDWIELYNPNEDPVFLGDYFLTNSVWFPERWKMPDEYIQPGEFLLIWADGQPEQGTYHTNFTLNDYGEVIVLYPGTSSLGGDACTFAEQTVDISEGRLPNGGVNWVSFDSPTPGASNEPLGIHQHANRKNVNIFPNPAAGSKVYLSYPSNYEIFNSWGQKVYSAKDSQEFNISDYNNGIYFVVIETGQRIKLIVN